MRASQATSRAWCDALYERREIFEATNKALSFVPASEFPWFRHVMGRKGPRFHNAALAENAAVAERVLERIRAEGPLSSHDFEREAGATKDWFGMPENAVRSVLEAYTVTGVIGLARRDGNIRYYDLLERLLPAELLAQEVPERDKQRHKLLSRLPRPRPARRRRRRRHLRPHRQPAGAQGAPPGAGRARRARARRRRGHARQALRRSPGSSRCWRRRRSRQPSVAFIAPFDSLLWDTALLASLFDFEYVWEGFFPPAKRRWGYYVLPILFGDRFVGRIEPRIDRGRGRVEVLDVWWEDGFAPRRAVGFVEAMREALRDYLRFAGADGIEWPPHLATEKRLFR